MIRPMACAKALACLALLSSEGVIANTLSANVADYNAAQVAIAGGALTVPTGLATYTVTSGSLTVGSNLTVTLPPNFVFSSTPTLSNTGTSTFTLSSGGNGSQSATFTVATADLTAGQSLSLNTFNVQGATALEALITVANALPLTIQAIGTDANALSVGAFASEPGARGIFVGAIQFVDFNPPTLGTAYGTNPPTDSLLAVMNAVVVVPQTLDAATNSHVVLSPNGLPNTLAPTDTYSLTMGGKWLGIASVFASTTSDCANPTATGVATSTSLTLVNLPVNVEMFGCVVADGHTVLQTNANGYVPVTVAREGNADFLSASVNVEFAGEIVAFGSSPVAAPALTFGSLALLGLLVILVVGETLRRSRSSV